MFTTHHFCFTVSNLEKSLAFYQGTFGMEVVRLIPDRHGADISGIVRLPGARLKIAFLKLPFPGDLQLELMEFVSPPGQRTDLAVYKVGAAHICFMVEDIDAACALLRQRGVQFKSDPVELLVGTNKGGKAVLFEDPDGIGLELVQRAKPSNA
jgi:catechol 2,3-dioxygenase-like lactoylglutathione lyase family enzyme